MTRGLVLFDVVAAAARARPGSPAVTAQGQLLTYRELDGRADILAGALRRYGLSRGDRVAIWCDGGVDAAAAVVAALRCGAIVVGIDADAADEMAAETLAATRPRTVICGADRFDTVAAAIDSRPTVVVGLGAAGPDGDLADPAVAGISSPTPFLRATDASAAFAFPVGETPVRQRHAVVSHRAMWLRTRGPAQVIVEPRLVAWGPFGSVDVLTTLFRAWQRHGLVSLDPPEAGVDGATVVTTAATVTTTDVAAGVLSDAAVVEVVAHAPTDAIRGTLERLAPGVVGRVAFATAAAGPIASGALDDAGRPEASCGVLEPVVTVDVVDGELVVASPMLFTEWFDDPDSTSEELVDDTLATRLVGTVDPDGYVTVTGPVDRRIPVGADDVDPAEVERVLLTHPAISEAVVVGVPDAVTGRAVCAVIVADGPAPTVEEVSDHVRTRLMRSRQPTRLVVVDEFPRTPDGAVNRHLVAATAAASQVELEDHDEPRDREHGDHDQRR